MATNKEIKKTLNGLMDFTKGVGTAVVNAKNAGLTEDKVKNAGLTTDETKAIINGLPTYDTDKNAAAKNEAWDAYKNRKSFSFDLNNDAFYNQYKDRYTQLGKQAMEDTVGQMSALTGGYGNTYAQTAGQQAYNQYMQQLNDVAPQLYQSAYDRYNAEGERLLDIYNAENAAEKENYGRYVDDYTRQAGLQDSAYNKLINQRTYEDNQRVYNDTQAEKKRQTAQDSANKMIESGQMPSDALLKAAGIDKGSAKAQVDKYNEDKTKKEKAENDSKVMYIAELGIMPDDKLIKSSSYDKKYVKSVVDKANSDKAEQKAKEEKNNANTLVLSMAQAGIMPDSKTIKASDYSEKDIKAIVNKANEQNALSASTGGKSTGSSSTSGKSTGSSSGGRSSGSSSGGKSTGSSTSSGYDNGSLTTAQVKEAQKYYGLTQDGKWGPNSRSVTGMSADEAYKAMKNAPKMNEKELGKSLSEASASVMTKREFQKRAAANGGKLTVKDTTVSTYKEYIEVEAAAFMKTDGWTASQADQWIANMLAK